MFASGLSGGKCTTHNVWALEDDCLQAAENNLVKKNIEEAKKRLGTLTVTKSCIGNIMI